MTNSVLEMPQFGTFLTPTGLENESDADWYRQMIGDAEFAADIGYDAVWSLEHHFSDYFPVPNPIVSLANIAARCPKLGLGTAVIVTPWHNPLRIASEIAMLTHLTDAPIRIGMGRGNAPLEYEAFGVEMAEAKDRFQESWEIIQLALSGKPFTYNGRHLKVAREVTMRPIANKTNLTFYGAIGHPSSAEKIAELGLAPMTTAGPPFEVQRKTMRTWQDATRARGGDTNVVRANCPLVIVADTDEEAVKLAREYVPKWYRLQQVHYAFDEVKYADVPGYASFNDVAVRRNAYSNPDNLGPLIDVNLIGSPETVCRKAMNYIDAGFNYFILNAATPGLPQDVRQGWLRRFMIDVVPLIERSIASHNNQPQAKRA
jgi:alkanesulfonate monooxygenase SsuD/methylene tetrahydromethanopterin reductase-like flavin-dependent oxidoreductase (luciferase family)